ncbi:hypothetical protein SAMN05660745_00702 [Corynebacterium glucuronolyticum]|nr:hypothetical protein CGLUCO_06920 [Corynebacterium glucuronolyticum DSM 44120]SMB80988.1 hypothetical protein SAMN05660745_00702 [Corynebacterium glucuronolyticum]
MNQKFYAPGFTPQAGIFAFHICPFGIVCTNTIAKSSFIYARFSGKLSDWTNAARAHAPVSDTQKVHLCVFGHTPYFLLALSQKWRMWTAMSGSGPRTVKRLPIATTYAAHAAGRHR